MKMPFGRYKGVLIADLPHPYLTWLRGLDDLREPLRSFVEAEWEARTAAPTASVEPPEPNVHAMIEELVTAGYRALAQRHHPDHGGEGGAMQLVNAAAAWLRSQVRRASK